MFIFSIPTLALLCLLPLLVLAAEDYYKILGVDRKSDSGELKRAYRRLSKKYHPDKNPNDETAARKFVEVSEAYEVLNDDDLRKIYNQYGHDGVEQHRKRQQNGGGARNPFDLFNQFFNPGHGGGQRKLQAMEVRVAVPLRDFYTGAEHEFRIEKQVICDKCDGSGAEGGETVHCATCNGHGVVVQKHMLAPGIFQQMQSQCDACGGRGRTVKHKCKKCGGARVVRVQEVVELDVEKGMPRGGRVTYEEEADQAPDHAAGDLVVQVVEQLPALAESEQHRTDGAFFRRKDQNLFWREVLSLREAWMGDWTRNLTHLDGHVVALSRKRGETVQPGHVEVVPDEGMPVYNWDGEGPQYGALHVEYVVVLPDQMESGMEKEFWAMWEKWRKKKGVDLHKDSGRPDPPKHEEL